MSGEPEYLDPLKDEAPDGWIVTGYPWNGIQTPEHKAFVDAYQASSTTIRGSARWSATCTIKSLAAGIKKAGSTDTEKLIAAFRGLQVDSPFGPFELPRQRPPVDAGRLCRQEREGRQGHDGRLQVRRRRQVLPSADEVKKLRAPRSDELNAAP